MGPQSSSPHGSSKCLHEEEAPDLGPAGETDEGDATRTRVIEGRLPPCHHHTTPNLHLC
jgi:hypothetical protein